MSSTNGSSRDPDCHATWPAIRLAPRVFLISPYSEQRIIVYGPSMWLRRPNVLFAQACMADCLRRGEAPFASHLLYTQPGTLHDEDPIERALGMDAGLRFLPICDYAVVYTDRGVSAGMKREIAECSRISTHVEFRKLQDSFVEAHY